MLYHGDFDWAGIHIANNVMKLCDARSWRFGAEDYIQAVKTIAPKERDLEDVHVAASWDTALGESMRSNGIAIAEEAIASQLVNDLQYSRSKAF